MTGRQIVVWEAKASLGQSGPLPVQLSATSQAPFFDRHTVVEDWKASAGQVVLDPVQFSAASHTPADARHTVLDGLKASAGHVALEPVQFSATSHTPAAARHTVPAFPAGCWQSSLLPSHSSRLHGLPSSVHAVPAALLASAGQLGPLPGQFSAGSHSPAEARQTVLEGVKASAGQTVLEPVQLSSTSHTPAAARHTVPAFPAGCWQSLLLPSHSSRLHGLPSLVHRAAAPTSALQ